MLKQKKQKVNYPILYKYGLIGSGPDDFFGSPYNSLDDEPDTRSAESLLEELVNTPPVKMAFWIEQHKQELKDLGVCISKEDKDG